MEAIWEDDTRTDSVRVQSFKTYISEGFLYSQPDSAIILADQLLSFSTEKAYQTGATEAYSLKGLVFRIMGNDALALDFFLLSLNINEKLDNKNGIARSLNNIGVIYQNQGDMIQAIDYFSRSLKTLKEVGTKKDMAPTLLNIGTIFHVQGDSEKALDYYSQSFTISQETGDKRGMARALGNIGIVLHEPESYDQAMDYYKQSSKIFEEIGDEQGVIINLTNIGELHMIQGNYTMALDYCHQALVNATELGTLPEQYLSCSCLYKTYKQSGETRLVLKYLEKLLVINDSINLEKAAKKLQQMEFAEKLMVDSLNQKALDRKIQKQHENEIRRKNKFRNIIIITGLLLLILSWGIYGRWRKTIAEKNLADEKIDRVLQFEQLRKLDVIMEGQDMERKRISEDLHDKLGGKFNTLQYTWSSIYTKELESKSEKADEFMALDNIIQSLSTEIRQIILDNAHSTGGELGLEDSLEELGYLVQSSHQMEINTLVHGINSIDKKIELELYKIILELVSNALKHSNGTHVNIHLNQVNRHVVLIVEDDGVGFNVSKVKSGMGLKNIRSRAERLGGVIELDSIEGKGTTVIMELDV